MSGTLGLCAYYRGMAVGAMSVVAPIAGISAIVPVTVGLATGDDPSAAQIAGIFVALIGVGLASREHQAGDRRIAAGVGLALLAAIGFGGYFVPMHAAGAADFWWASLVFRTTSFMLIAVAALAARRSVRVSRRDAYYVSAVGIGDTLGNVLYAASASYGLVSVTSVLASLYPVVTVVLARVVLHERVDRLAGRGHRRGARRRRAHLRRISDTSTVSATAVLKHRPLSSIDRGSGRMTAAPHAFRPQPLNSLAALLVNGVLPRSGRRATRVAPSPWR